MRGGPQMPSRSEGGAERGAFKLLFKVCKVGAASDLPMLPAVVFSGSAQVESGEE